MLVRLIVIVVAVLFLWASDIFNKHTTVASIAVVAVAAIGTTVFRTALQGGGKRPRAASEPSFARDWKRFLTVPSKDKQQTLDLLARDQQTRRLQWLRTDPRHSGEAEHTWSLKEDAMRAARAEDEQVLKAHKAANALIPADYTGTQSEETTIDLPVELDEETAAYAEELTAELGTLNPASEENAALLPAVDDLLTADDDLLTADDGLLTADDGLLTVDGNLLATTQDLLTADGSLAALLDAGEDIAAEIDGSTADALAAELAADTTIAPATTGSPPARPPAPDDTPRALPIPPPRTIQPAAKAPLTDKAIKRDLKRYGPLPGEELTTLARTGGRMRLAGIDTGSDFPGFQAFTREIHQARQEGGSMLWDMAQLSNEVAAVERYDPTKQRLCSLHALRQTHDNCYAVSVISLLHQSTVLSAMADHIRDYITSTWHAAAALGDDFGCPNLPDHVAKTYAKLTSESCVKNLSKGGLPEELLVAFLLHGHVMNTEQLDYLVHSGLLRDTHTSSGGDFVKDTSDIQFVLEQADKAASEPLFENAVAIPVSIHFGRRVVFNQQFVYGLRDVLAPDTSVEGGILVVADYIRSFDEDQKAKIGSMLQMAGKGAPYSHVKEYIEALESTIDKDTGLADLERADSHYLITNTGEPVRVSEMADKHTMDFLSKLVARNLKPDLHAVYFTVCRTQEQTRLLVCTWGHCDEEIYHIRYQMSRAEVQGVLLLKTRGGAT